MPLSDKSDELRRLVQAFEAEAAKFHPLTFSLYYVTQEAPIVARTFATPHHAIMLWQYYGCVEGDDGIARLAENIADSDLKWGVRGAAITCLGILEGHGCELFVRMAQRAGSLFDEDEAYALKRSAVEELLDSQQSRHVDGKQTAALNNNPLSLWLNYLLFHLSMTNPGRERAQRIEPDPFALSLLALEGLYSLRRLGKVDKSTRSIRDLQFRVAMSLPGEHRSYVSATVDALRPHLAADSVFYDHDYQAQLARPNLDVLLQDIYGSRSDLLVVFLSKEYSEKQWCGLEWRAVRDLIKNRRDDQVMFVRFDDANVDGVFSLDGYIDARLHGPERLAELILQRLA